MKYFITLIILAVLSSCEPKVNSTRKVESLPTTTDTVGTVETDITDTVTRLPIIIYITDNKVEISSSNVNTVYATDVDNLRVIRNEQGAVEYLQVNNVVLFKQKNNINHTYHYLDHNFIEVVRGNTIDGIIADHPEFGLSRNSLYQCNPILKQRGLQIGDRIKLDCN